ncbi:MAG: YihY/virulence factor BrkB family protein [Rickettsiaceae bacterium]|nr:YihY/virulence factor BrkB family protein [Rickettsiaceae bacterium]
MMLKTQIFSTVKVCFYKYLDSFYNAIVRTINNDGIEHAGYMSFMVILSFFPFLVFFLSLTYTVGDHTIGQIFIDVMIDSVPDYAIGTISVWLEELKRAPPRGIMNLAIIGTIWTASSFVECLRTILNKILGVTTPPPYITRRLLSIVQFIILCILIIIVMVVFVLLPNMFEHISLYARLYTGDFWGNFWSDLWGYYKDLYLSISLFFCVLGFYTFVPNTKLSLTKMMPGAILTTILWELCGKFFADCIVYYQQLNIVYGSLGNIIITLMFLYIINFIFIVGAAFNYRLNVYMRK